MSEQVPLGAVEGRRERKRRETHDRIAKAAIKLFLKLGYEETTMDAIAEAADVSRRSLFHYFSSKEDVLFANQEKFLSAVVEEIRRQPEEWSWPALIESAMVRAIADAANPENIAIDRLVRNTPALQSRHQLKYVHLEQAIAGALAERCDSDEASRRRAELLAAVVVAGFRISTTTSGAVDAKGHKSTQQSVPEQFQHFWQSLLEFGNEGTSYHQHEGQVPRQTHGSPSKNGGKRK